MQHIKEILYKERLKQYELAANLNISNSYLSNIVRNKRGISIKLANIICDKYPYIDFKELLSRSHVNEKR
jgi:transcriptional regulator with XRE-family HTH domain